MRLKTAISGLKTFENPSRALRVLGSRPKGKMREITRVLVPLRKIRSQNKVQRNCDLIPSIGQVLFKKWGGGSAKPS